MPRRARRAAPPVAAPAEAEDPPEVPLVTGRRGTRVAEGAKDVVLGAYHSQLRPATEAPDGGQPPAWGVPDSAGYKSVIWMGWVPGVGYAGVDDLDGLAVLDADRVAVEKWLEERADAHGKEELKELQ